MKILKYTKIQEGYRSILGKFTLKDTNQTKDKYGNISKEEEFICFGLEGSDTLIENGIYKLGLRDIGGFHERYKNKYAWHKGMLEVIYVPNRRFILIHIGNTYRDTAGCLLTGKSCYTHDKEMRVGNSRVAYELLYNKVIRDVMNSNMLIEIS